MKKKLILLGLVVILLTGCSNIKYNEDYYRSVSDTAVSFFKDKEYNSESFDDITNQSLQTYLTTLTHENEEIELTNYFKAGVRTPNTNTEYVYIENNKCYIKYEDLNRLIKSRKSITNEASDEIENYYKGVCNNRIFYVYESQLKPSYEQTTNNPRYDYILLKDDKFKGEYIFYYRSTYDGTGLMVTLTKPGKQVTNISVELANVDGVVQGE